MESKIRQISLILLNEQGVTWSCLLFLFFLPHLCCPRGEPSELLRSNLTKILSQTLQITVNLSGLLKTHNKTPTPAEFPMIRCSGEEVSHSLSYCEISSLSSVSCPNFWPNRGRKVSLRNKTLLSLSVPCPRQPDLPRSALASPNCSPKLLHHFQSCG